MKKINVGVVFGGRSAEHAVSLQSAQNIIQALDSKRYDIQLIKIDLKGVWHMQESILSETTDTIALVPGKGIFTKDFIPCDVVFPILHGPFGEDGTVQGLLKLLNIPFVGSSVLGSALCMDKDLTKKVLQQAGLPVCRWRVLKRNQFSENDLKTIQSEIGIPCFVKPANLGSSVGISQVHTQEELRPALENAFQYDHKVIIEEKIVGRELEVALLGHDAPSASAVGEIIVQEDFYSYHAKYLSPTGALLSIPAKLEDQVACQLQTLAIQAFQVLECSGLARCDFFLSHSGKIYINEINTLPGFTKISMYPKLWEYSGVSYSELLDRLIQLALERHAADQILKTTPLKE